MDDERVINLLRDILEEEKKQTKELQNLTNLFLRYDLEMQAEAIESEEGRELPGD